MSALATAPGTSTNGDQGDDHALVDRTRRGDDLAFETLYSRYQRRITAYIQGMVHDHGRAEDLAQDVFVSALRRMRETDRPIAFKPWIYEIAKNACIDQFRRTRRAEEVSYDADDGLGAADYGRLVSTEAMPDAELESKQQLDDLRGAFGGLSETHHQILVMRELEGLSYRQIGERLGMSRPSVESTLFRARRRLTEEYEELVTGARCQRIQALIGNAADSELGLRDQRRLARHVSHCQPCRRQARLAGLDVPVTADRPLRQRIAAVLPLPVFLRRRWLGDAGEPVQVVGQGHLGTLAQWSSQLGSTVDPSWIKAAATAATVAVAGVGAGLATPHAGSLPGFGRVSLSPVAHSRSAVRDERAEVAGASVIATPGEAFTVGGKRSTSTGRPVATTSDGRRETSAPTGAHGTQRGVPGIDEVTGGIEQQAGTLSPPPGSGSGSGGTGQTDLSSPTASDVPTAPKADTPALQPPGVQAPGAPQPPSTQVPATPAPPDASGTVGGASATANDTAAGAQGTADDAGGKLGGAIGGG